MERKMPHGVELLIKYGSCMVVAGLLIWFYLSSHGLAETETTPERLVMWCDALTIPGLLYILVGALIWAAGFGALDGIGYGLSTLFRSLIPGGRAKKQKTYYEHVMDRREKRLAVTKYAFLFFSGLVLMAAAVVLLIVYYNYAA